MSRTPPWSVVLLLVAMTVWCGWQGLFTCWIGYLAGCIMIKTGRAWN